MGTSIASILSDLASAAKAAKAIADLLTGKRGDVRALIQEIRHNVDLCWLVLEYDEPPSHAVPKAPTRPSAYFPPRGGRE